MQRVEPQASKVCAFCISWDELDSFVRSCGLDSSGNAFIDKNQLASEGALVFQPVVILALKPSLVPPLVQDKTKTLEMARNFFLWLLRRATQKMHNHHDCISVARDVLALGSCGSVHKSSFKASLVDVLNQSAIFIQQLES